MNSSKFFNRCGICAIYDFINNGVHGVKIAGRDLTLQKKIKDIELVQEAIDLAQHSKSKKEYQEKAIRLFEKYKGYSCRKNYCYYTGIFDEP